MRFNFANLWAKLENVKARYLPIGGPATLDGVIALRVAPTATDASFEQQPFLAIGDDANGEAPQTLLGVAARMQGFDGQFFYAVRTMSFDVAQQTDDAPGVLVTAKKTDWSQAHVPAAATIATTQRAAPGAGQCHVITGITACIAAAAAATGPLIVTLVDSSGTRWAGTVSAPVQGSGLIVISGLSIACAENSAVTLAFGAAGAAGSQETVALQGYTTAS